MCDKTSFFLFSALPVRWQAIVILHINLYQYSSISVIMGTITRGLLAKI